MDKATLDYAPLAVKAVTMGQDLTRKALDSVDVITEAFAGDSPIARGQTFEARVKTSEGYVIRVELSMRLLTGDWLGNAEPDS